MMAAIVLSLAFIGNYARHIVAIVGGIGFGVFIDELGKFITKDNDYFFQPTIGLIYAIFIILYLTFNFLTRYQKLSSKEYQLNALIELEEAIALDFDRKERDQIYALLDQSDQNSAITKHIRGLVDKIRVTTDTEPSTVAKIMHKVNEAYEKFWKLRNSNLLVRCIFVAQIALLSGAIIYTLYVNIDDVIAIANGSLTYCRE